MNRSCATAWSRKLNPLPFSFFSSFRFTLWKTKLFRIFLRHLICKFHLLKNVCRVEGSCNPFELVFPDALPSTSNCHSAVIKSSVPKTVLFFAHLHRPKACPVLSNQTCLQVQFSKVQSMFRSPVYSLDQSMIH